MDTGTTYRLRRSRNQQRNRQRRLLGRNPMTISHGASENPLGEAAFYNRATGELETIDEMEAKLAGEDWATNALGDILGQITELSEKVDKLEMLVTKVLDEIVPHIDSVAKGPIGKMLGLGK
jgi:hypothetical protein